MMKIEIWSDVVCPYCYVASVRLRRAWVQFKHKDSVEMALRSFELEPEIARYSAESQHQAVMRKYRQSAAQAQHILDMAAMAAAESGIIINWNQVQTTNSFDAHRLLHAAKRYGNGPEMEHRLFRAYFTDGLHIGKLENLIHIGEELGLDCRGELEENAFSEAVRMDEEEALYLGIHSVPCLVIDRKFAINGARSEGDYLDILEESYLENLR